MRSDPIAHLFEHISIWIRSSSFLRLRLPHYVPLERRSHKPRDFDQSHESGSVFARVKTNELSRHVCTAYELTNPLVNSDHEK